MIPAHISITSKSMPLYPNQDKGFQWVLISNDPHHILQESLHSPSIHQLKSYTVDLWHYSFFLRIELDMLWQPYQSTAIDTWLGLPTCQRTKNYFCVPLSVDKSTTFIHNWVSILLFHPEYRSHWQNFSRLKNSHSKLQLILKSLSRYLQSFP